MPWNNITRIVVSKKWQFSQKIEGSLFRVQHTLSEAPPYGFRGLIAQSTFGSRGIELFEIQRIYPTDELTIFEFKKPICFTDRVIAIKGQTRYQTRIQWSVNIDVWK